MTAMQMKGTIFVGIYHFDSVDPNTSRYLSLHGSGAIGGSGSTARSRQKTGTAPHHRQNIVTRFGI